jgi:hypothetical protein
LFGYLQSVQQSAVDAQYGSHVPRFAATPPLPALALPADPPAPPKPWCTCSSDLDLPPQATTSATTSALSIEMIEAVRPVVPRIKRHDRSLADQLVRAASSVALNIAEGEHSDPGNRKARLAEQRAVAERRTRARARGLTATPPAWRALSSSCNHSRSRRSKSRLLASRHPSRLLYRRHH